MLPVTAPASSRSRVRARRRHAFRGGTDDLDRVRPQVRPRLLGDRRRYSLARRTMAHEDDTAIVGSRDTAPAGRDRACFELQQRKIPHGGQLAAMRLPAVLTVPPVACGSRPASSSSRLLLFRSAAHSGGVLSLVGELKQASVGATAASFLDAPAPRCKLDREIPW